jgi:hypothetical protein
MSFHLPTGGFISAKTVGIFAAIGALLGGLMGLPPQASKRLQHFLALAGGLSARNLGWPFQRLSYKRPQISPRPRGQGQVPVGA